MGLLKEKYSEFRKEEVAEMLKRYNIKELSDTKHSQAIDSIMNDFAEGKHIIPSTAPDLNTNSYLYAIMQQNLIIIDLLDRIASKL